MGIRVLPLQILELPPGFRFHPTDEEIITCNLREKVMDKTFTAIAIAEVDLNKSEPWNLPGKSKMGEKEWFFFCERDRKYPTGQRRNRATESGYWKATGKDKEIYTGKRCLVGMKKTLVFYKGRAPKGDKTNWVMHEYRLEGNLSFHHKLPKDQWVICRVFHKKIGVGNVPVLLDSFMDNLLDNPSALPCLIEMPLSSDNTRTSKFATNEHNIPAAATSFDEIPSSASFNNYNYKQNQLLREEDKSYGSFLPAEHIFTSTNNDYQHTYNNLASFHHDQILLTNSFFSEFNPIQNYALERPQKDSSNNNSMISLSRHSHVANEISSVTPNQGFDRGKQFEDNFKDQDLSVDPIAADLYSIWNY